MPSTDGSPTRCRLPSHGCGLDDLAVGLALGAIWIVLLAVSATVFDREAVLTRWR